MFKIIAAIFIAFLVLSADFFAQSDAVTIAHTDKFSAQWIGGNQDPIFIRDLFHTDESPNVKNSGRNRSRYSNSEFDKIIESAITAKDKVKEKEFYAKAQMIVARDLPYITLWYPKNLVIANKRIGNVKINAGGDWSFVKNLTLVQN
jgi:ABC-type transport system substrate-binding protein